MNQTPQRPESDELELLQHYRRHTHEQPSAELDERILAAARQAVSRQAPRPGLLARLRTWLFAGNPRARWSVALASLATVGLGLGLAMRTLEQAPSSMDAMPPLMAPAPISSYSTSPQPERRMLSRQLAEEVPAAPAALADSQAEVDPNAGHGAAGVDSLKLKEKVPPGAAGMAKSDAPVKPESELQQALREILALRRQGKVEAADQQLKALQEQHPQRDLSVELKHLEQSEPQKD